MTVYLPTEEEDIEGIGPWLIEEAQPFGNPETLPGLAEFERDRVARLNAHYAAKRELANDPDAWLMGSLGQTSIYLPKHSAPEIVEL